MLLSSHTTRTFFSEFAYTLSFFGCDGLNVDKCCNIHRRTIEKTGLVHGLLWLDLVFHVKKDTVIGSVITCVHRLSGRIGMPAVLCASDLFLICLHSCGGGRLYQGSISFVCIACVLCFSFSFFCTFSLFFTPLTFFLSSIFSYSP
jgi:hypothetical protein